MPKKEKPKKLSLEDMSKKIAELTGIVDGCLKFVTKLAEDLRPALASIQTSQSDQKTDIVTNNKRISDIQHDIVEIRTRLSTTISELHTTMGTFENHRLNLEPVFKSLEHPLIGLNADNILEIQGHKFGEILVYSEFVSTMVSAIAREALKNGEFKLNPKKAAEILLALGFFVPADTNLEEETPTPASNAENPFNKEGTDDGDNGHPIL